MDVAVANSFILHKKLFEIKTEPTTTKPLDQRTFREQLAAEMLEIFDTAPPPSPPQMTCMPLYYGRDASNTRKYCKRCHKASILRVKTSSYCRKCQIPLCLTSKKNCFQMWHGKQ